MTARELATTDENRQACELLFSKHEAAFLGSFPVASEAARALRIAKTAILSNPKLIECTSASLLTGVMQSMQLGLVLDGVLGHSYLVPYYDKNLGRKQAQFQAGYKGLMELAFRSDKVRAITARVVRDGDSFEWEEGTDAHLKHKPKPNNGEAQVTYIWAMATCVGAKPFAVMTFEEVDAIRKKAKSQTGPWLTHPFEMMKKTVIRNLCKTLPVSTDMQRAIALSERADAGLPPVIEEEPTTVEPVEPEDDGKPPPMPKMQTASEMFDDEKTDEDRQFDEDARTLFGDRRDGEDA